MQRFFRTTDGLVLCEKHMREVFPKPSTDVVVEIAPESWDLTKPIPEPTWFLPPECGLCGQVPAPGRRCGYCGDPLHELWPAVYCSMECALDDA